MNASKYFSRFSVPVLALATCLFVVACGGSGNGASGSTGTVGLLFTDKPSDDFSEINLNVIEAVLIGGDGQQTLFQGSKSINLLDLTNFNEPVVFGEVNVGVYTKLRLVINRLELVPHGDGPPILPALPANGKIDLLEPAGFEVLPGRTLLAEIDIDANKSIKITGAGNSGRYNFRPVVKAHFMDGGLPDKLARVEGIVSELFAAPAGSFRLCDVDMPGNCLHVTTGAGTSIFDDEGLATVFDTLAANDPVVVIGRYVLEPEITLNALILEIGGNAEQLSGNVVSAPVTNQFLLDIGESEPIVVELQDATRYFDATGEIGPDAIVIDADLEVEGVRPMQADPADPDLIRAALVFVEAEDAEQLSGTILGPPDAAMRHFDLAPVDGGDTCVNVAADTEILLVDAAASTATMGAFSDLADGQFVDLFGAMGMGCFQADEVIVDVVAL